MKQWATSMKFCLLVQKGHQNFIPQGLVESYKAHWIFAILKSQTIEIEFFLARVLNIKDV